MAFTKPFTAEDARKLIGSEDNDQLTEIVNKIKQQAAFSDQLFIHFISNTNMKELEFRGFKVQSIEDPRESGYLISW